VSLQVACVLCSCTSECWWVSETLQQWRNARCLQQNLQNLVKGCQLWAMLLYCLQSDKIHLSIFGLLLLFWVFFTHFPRIFTFLNLILTQLLTKSVFCWMPVVPVLEPRLQQWPLKHFDFISAASQCWLTSQSRQHECLSFLVGVMYAIYCLLWYSTQHCHTVCNWCLDAISLPTNNVNTDRGHKENHPMTLSFNADFATSDFATSCC